MSKAVALIPTDLARSRLGLPSMLSRVIAGRTVLAHTVARVARVDAVASIILVHPADQDPRPLLGGVSFDKPVACVADADGLRDAYQPMRSAARRWAMTAWRGGLGGATCYDELLPAAPLVRAMHEHQADSALLVGADWMLVDPSLCQRVLQRHLADPKSFAFTFSQAPPGLAGAAIGRALLSELAEHRGTFGRMLAYNPSRPQADPIGRDVCIQTDPTVRSCARRFIADTPRARRLIEAIHDHLGDRLPDADAAAVVTAVPHDADELAALPPQVTLELTPRRPVTGFITPQHHVPLDRGELPTDAAIDLVRQVAAEPDTVLLLGGLGDALLHPSWDRIVQAAHDAGVFGIGIETDLLVPPATIERLLDLPLDLVTVRLNADTAAVYDRTMGGDFKLATGNLEHLLNTRNARSTASCHDAEHGRDGRGTSLRSAAHWPGVPWLIARLIKTGETLADMETFFDRWTHFAGHAVIEPAATGRAADGQPLMPALSPVNMAPPMRFACRQLARRMTLHSDGRMVLCDQDWLGAVAVNGENPTLAEKWAAMRPRREAQRSGQWDRCALCAGCDQWHRP